MQINKGNIFEVMRLILPEHRGVMKDWHKERSKRKPPLITEDQAEQIQYTLSEAVETGNKVCLTLFGEYGDTVLEGSLAFDGRLRITTEEGIINVPVKKLIKAVLT